MKIIRQVSFREHVLEPRPFLIVAVIAVSRRVIVLTAELSKLLTEDERIFQHALFELGILTILAVTLGVVAPLTAAAGAQS